MLYSNHHLTEWYNPLYAANHHVVLFIAQLNSSSCCSTHFTLSYVDSNQSSISSLKKGCSSHHCKRQTLGLRGLHLNPHETLNTGLFGCNGLTQGAP